MIASVVLIGRSPAVREGQPVRLRLYRGDRRVRDWPGSLALAEPDQPRNEHF